MSFTECCEYGNSILDMTNIVEILFILSIAILAAFVIVGFFAVRRYIQKRVLNKYEDHD